MTGLHQLRPLEATVDEVGARYIIEETRITNRHSPNR
jgi:hypothetical protein